MANDVWVVRHAQSVANRGDVSTTLHSDIPLSTDGMAAAQLFADRFDRTPDLIIVSPYLRTRQTAAPFIEKYNTVPVEIWPIQEFDFLDNQKCLGKTVDTRRAMRDEYIARADPNWRDGPHTETFNEMVGRARDFIARVKQRPEQFIVAFSHGHFIKTLGIILDGAAPTIQDVLGAGDDIANLGIFKF